MSAATETISVVVVTKDRPAFLATLLESLVHQTMAPLEVLVVVDTGSAPSYRPVFAQFRERLPLRVVEESEPGIPAARNRGVAESVGDLILFTDDDCIADPGWVEAMVRPFRLDPFIGAVGGETRGLDRTGSLVERFCNLEGMMHLGDREQPA